jgi:hypothetical protein
MGCKTNSARRPVMTTSVVESNTSKVSGCKRMQQDITHAPNTVASNLKQLPSCSSRNEHAAATLAPLSYLPRANSDIGRRLQHRRPTAHACQLQNKSTVPQLQKSGEFFREVTAIPTAKLPPYRYRGTPTLPFYPPPFALFPPIQPYPQLAAQTPIPMSGVSFLQPPWVPPSYAQIVAARMPPKTFPLGFSPQLPTCYPTPQMGPF